MLQGVLGHRALSPEAAKKFVKRNEHESHKCRRALQARNEQVYTSLLMKRDAYGFVIGNDTEYTPQGFKTSLCSLAPEEEVGPYVLLSSLSS